MAGTDQAPIYELVVEGFSDNRAAGFNGKMRQAWILFFQNFIAGDSGTQFTPTVTGLTHDGSDPSITGIYFQNDGFIDFYIYVIGNPSTNSISGSTYFTLPFTVRQDTHCTIVTGINGVSLGVINAATGRVYTPTWTTVSTPLTITGRVRTT